MQTRTNRDWTRDPWKSQLIRALEEHEGNVKATAKSLHIERGRLGEMVHASPELQAAQERGWARIYHSAVSKLQEAVADGDIKALNLFFRTSPYAKRRGWGDHMQIGGDPDGKNLAETAKEVFGLQPEGPGEAEPAPAGG